MSKSKKMKRNKICLSGGHGATSALAVIEMIKKTHENWEMMWIGSQNAFAKEKASTLDFQVFPKMGVECFSISAGKLQRNLSISSAVDLIKFPIGFFQALKILNSQKPALVISFGGYAALPVVWAAKLVGIKSLIHEQTVGAGLANKLSLPVVSEVLLSRSESEKFFPHNKKRLVGLPLHRGILSVKNLPKKNPETLYVTGGSRGSRTINQVVKQVLPLLLKSFKVIHHTGSLDIDEFIAYKKLLPAKVRNNYEVFELISPLEIDKVYQKADIVVARSGAHTTAEIMALGKAAIFIPIPWVQMNEQMENARLAEKYSNSVIIEEKNLNTDSLLGSIFQLKKDWKKLKFDKNNEISRKDRLAAGEIVQVIEEYVQ